MAEKEDAACIQADAGMGAIAVGSVMASMFEQKTAGVVPSTGHYVPPPPPLPDQAQSAAGVEHRVPPPPPLPDQAPPAVGFVNESIEASMLSTTDTDTYWPDDMQNLPLSHLMHRYGRQINDEVPEDVITWLNVVITGHEEVITGLHDIGNHFDTIDDTDTDMF